MNIEGKNIWILNHYATDMYLEGAGRHFWFAENLIKANNSVTIFCANTLHNSEDKIDTNQKKFTEQQREQINFVFVETTIAMGNGLDRVKNMLLFYKNVLAVSKEYAKSKGKPDVILASSVHPLTMVAGIKMAKKLGVPCICEIRDLWPEAIFAFGKVKEQSLLGRILTKGEHWIYKNADALIFTKEGDTDYIKEKKWDIESGGAIDLGKAHYINNGLDIGKFKSSAETNRIDDNDLVSEAFNVTYVGSIRPVNDVGKILDAAKLLKNQKDVQFLIYGNGNELETIKKRVEEEDLSNVKIKGYVDKKYIPYILSKSSINLLNYSQTQYNWSRGNSSNKLFEYMASGKPVISTVKMGYSIIEKYKCGIELADASSEELANAILTIKNYQPAEYEALAKNAEKGAGDFDFTILTEKLKKVIGEVITKDSRLVAERHYEPTETRG